jgi:tetratricopeptide (TPR) repeat protein
MTTEPEFDLARAHRWFGVEFNNLAWNLVEAEGRSPEETERMIHLAHASVCHWLEVGNLLNRLRGMCLLSTAHAAAGQADPAVRCAEECLALSRKAGDTQTVFDRATAHGCASRAYALAGRIEEARRNYASAVEAITQSQDSDDRPVFDRLYPKP